MSTNQISTTNPLVKLSQEFGQSIWIDYIRRNMLTTGELNAYVAEDNLGGLTSNPAIFEKAIAASSDYNDQIKQITSLSDLTPMELYEKLAIQDIQQACDILKPKYDKTNCKDGYASLEVSPYLANDAKASLEEARRLWKLVSRPNVMIKVPATPECIPVIETLISEGINVNVTLLFSTDSYEKVAIAYINGLEKLKNNGGNITKVASVASFFISRIDTLIDSKLNAIINEKPSSEEAKLAQSLLGKIAIANAKQAHKIFKKLFNEPRFIDLANRGAKPQRLLWASTSTKDPKYRDVIYVEELIAPETVNTIPPATYAAFKDHGIPRFSLEENINQADETLKSLAKLKIDLKEATDELLIQGVKLFSDAFDKLLEAVALKRADYLSTSLNQMQIKLPKDLEQTIKSTTEEWRLKGILRQIWRNDSLVWTGNDESKWLGWLKVVDEEFFNLNDYLNFQKEVHSKAYTDAVLLGMGGSSLGPEVLSESFGNKSGFPTLHVLDSTHPEQIKAIHDKIDLNKTLFIVSSKSGSTLEPNVLMAYFYDEVSKLNSKPGEQFIAITDPESSMEAKAKELNFWKIFYGYKSIGGRYSVLSNFGMIPLTILGYDVKTYFEEALHMVHSCSSSVPPAQNPGCLLGLTLGLAQKIGHDKITFITTPSVKDLGAWFEQLIAESTGKIGTGLIPVDLEELAEPKFYGKDRVFVFINNLEDKCTKYDDLLNQLEQKNHPVIRISMNSKAKLAQEFFRWEFAIAVSGAILKINPFDQPDVEDSKVITRNLTQDYEKEGVLKKQKPFFSEGNFEFYTDSNNIKYFEDKLNKNLSTKAIIKEHISRLKPNDYFAILAFIERNTTNAQLLSDIRHKVRNATTNATVLGFGPRFLHSTGQLYKGGPNTIVALQITSDNNKDLNVPNMKASFGLIKDAQALGDFEVLSKRNRRLLNIHIKGDLQSGLKEIAKILD